MNTLHPVFQQAMAPYMPSYSKDVIEYEWVVNPLLKITCRLDYTEEEIGLREHGVQIEPDYPASMTLISALIHRTNVLALLSDEQIAEIEVLAIAMYGRG